AQYRGCDERRDGAGDLSPSSGGGGGNRHPLYEAQRSTVDADERRNGAGDSSPSSGGGGGNRHSLYGAPAKYRGCDERRDREDASAADQWWRRRESNPRPEAHPSYVYVRSSRFLSP